MTWASNSNDYFELAEVLPTNRGVQPYVGPFNGDAQWDIRLFFKPTDLTNAHCLWASTGAFNTMLNTGVTVTGVGGGISGMGLLCTGTDAKLHGLLDVSGHFIQVASGVLTVNTVYEAELNLDGSHNVNLFVGTGGTVTRVAQTASGGTAIAQRADENHVLGQAFGVWPFSGNFAEFQGAMQSVQISNIARHTGASYTENTANFANDGNTLFLDNFDLNQFVGGARVNPTVQVDFPNNSWMALHIGELGCCGGTYNVSGFHIEGAETVGVYADGAAIDISHVTADAAMYGIEVSRTAGFNSFIHDITEAPGVAPNATVGILSLGGITFIRDVILPQANMFSIYTTGASIENAYIAGNTRTVCDVAVETFGQGVAVGPIHIANIVEDSEAGGTFPGVCISGGGPVSITGSILSPQGSSSVQLFNNVGTVTLQGDNFLQLTNPIVDATYATPTVGESIVFDNDVFAGLYSPISNNYTNFSFPYSVVGATPIFHHLQYGVVPTPEPGAVNGGPLCVSTTSCAYPVPAMAHVGDIEVAAVEIQGAPGAVTPPTGWTLACAADNGANNEYVADYWHVVTPNDTATYLFTDTNPNVWRGGMASFSNVNQLAPVDKCVASLATGTTSITLTGATSSDQNDIEVFTAGNSGVTGSALLTFAVLEHSAQCHIPRRLTGHLVLFATIDHHSDSSNKYHFRVSQFRGHTVGLIASVQPNLTDDSGRRRSATLSRRAGRRATKPGHQHAHRSA
jgi:hypothetical protein